MYNTAIKQIYTVSKTLFNYYVDDVPTKYWRYGQLTIMVVPVILTAGEWGLAKGASIVAKLTTKYGSKAKEVAEIVADATKVADNAAEITSDASKIVVNAEQEIVTIEKAGGETTITRVKGAGNELLTIGKSGINDAVAKGYTNIDNYLASSDYANKLVSDFAKYQSKGGALTLEKYTVKHKTITQNRLKGSVAEEVFQDLEGGIVKRTETGIQTADGTFRYVDNILNGTGREIKSGFISNTTSVRKQIIDDLDIIKNQRSLDVQRMEWHCFEGVDPQLINWVKSEMTRLQIPFEKFKFVTYK